MQCITIEEISDNNISIKRSAKLLSNYYCAQQCLTAVSVKANTSTNSNFNINSNINSNAITNTNNTKFEYWSDVLNGAMKSGKHEPNSVYAGVFKAKDVKQFRERSVVNGKYLHRCKWIDCEYQTQSTHSIVKHIHVKHIGIKELKCAQPNCAKTFKRPESLAEHQKDHFCGFRIDVNKYKYGKGLCSYYNIKKYYKRVRVNEEKKKVNQYSYHCQWNDCYFISLWSNGMMRHIHSQHICPNRDKSSNVNTK